MFNRMFSCSFTCMQLKVTERFGNDNAYLILLQLIAPDAKYESIVHLHAETTHPPHKHRKNPPNERIQKSKHILESQFRS